MQHINKVPQAVVPTDNVPFPNAANGVIAENIHGLRAHRAGDITINNREAETIQDGNAEIARRQNSIVAIFAGRNLREEAIGVRLGTSRQALELPIIGS